MMNGVSALMSSFGMVPLVDNWNRWDKFVWWVELMQQMVVFMNDTCLLNWESGSNMLEFLCSYSKNFGCFMFWLDFEFFESLKFFGGLIFKWCISFQKIFWSPCKKKKNCNRMIRKECTYSKQWDNWESYPRSSSCKVCIFFSCIFSVKDFIFCILILFCAICNVSWRWWIEMKFYWCEKLWICNFRVICNWSSEFEELFGNSKIAAKLFTFWWESLKLGGSS